MTLSGTHETQPGGSHDVHTQATKSGESYKEGHDPRHEAKNFVTERLKWKN